MSANTFQVVERLLDRLTTEEQITVIEQLAVRLRQTVHHKPPKNLYGIWRDRFPIDFDLDSALHEMWSEWETEWTPNR